MTNPIRQRILSDAKAYALDIDSLVSSKRLMQILKNPGATTVQTLGLAAAPTLDATTSDADDSDCPLLNHATAASANSASGVISAAFTIIRRDWEVEYVTVIKTDSTLITSTRLWVGLFSASPDAVATPTAIHCAAFRYDTGVDGTAFWRAVTSAASASPTTTATSQSIAINTLYLMRIVCSNLSGDVKFYINNVLVATHTATLPTSSQLLGYGNRVIALAASARNLKWGRIMILHN